MRTSDRILSKIFLYGLPAVLGLALFCGFYERGFFKGPAAGLAVLHDLTGLVLAVWMALTIYLSARLIVSEPFRDKVLARITFIKERDEREALLTGKATKTTFLATLALLFFLLCLSCFQVSVYRLPPEKAVNGKTGIVSLGVHVDLFQGPAARRQGQEIRRQDIFLYTALPVSATGIILLLIIWQVAWYNILMRRAIK